MRVSYKKKHEAVAVWAGSGYSLMASAYEHRNEPSVPINPLKFM
jgi:hypothetical protein